MDLERPAPPVARKQDLWDSTSLRRLRKRGDAKVIAGAPRALEERESFQNSRRLRQNSAEIDAASSEAR